MNIPTAIAGAAALIVIAIVWASQPAHTQATAGAYMLVADTEPGFVWRMSTATRALERCDSSALGSGCRLVAER
jgi:hypothetical protein